MAVILCHLFFVFTFKYIGHGITKIRKKHRAKNGKTSNNYTYYYSAMYWEKQDRNINSYSDSYFSVYILFLQPQALIEYLEPIQLYQSNNEQFPLVSSRTSQYFVCGN